MEGQDELREKIDTLTGELLSQIGCDFSCERAEAKALDAKEGFIDAILSLIDKPPASILSDEEKDMAWRAACGDNTDLVKLNYPDVLLQAQVKKCHKYYQGGER